MQENHEIRICHLYAHFLNIYGDRGNILTLVKRSQWRGIKTEVTAFGLGDKLDIGKHDIYFIGGGQDKQQQVIAEDLQRHKKALKEATDAGAVILSICGGYQLLGHYYRPHEGPELPGLSLIDAHTLAGRKRMIGNVVVKRADGSTLVGFENHSGKTFLGSANPLGRVTTGNGNNGEDGFEGVADGTIFGTYLHGSLLPKNPQFADQLITLALKRRYGDVHLPALEDAIELDAHKHALYLPA